MVNKPTPNTTKEGPPRWTYAAGAIVAIGTLVWGVVSYFVPRPEPLNPALTPAPPAVSISGSDNVGIGTMTGGQITHGVVVAPTVPASAPPPKTDSKP